MSKKKVNVQITVSVMSLDSVPALLSELSQVMRNENDTGYLEKEDGDNIRWKTQ